MQVPSAGIRRDGMELERWEPFDALMPLRDAVNRLFEESFVGPRRFETLMLGRAFPIDVVETEDAFVVDAALPGFAPEEVEITALGDTLTIHATRKPVEKDEEKGTGEKTRAYIRRERYVGEINRTITLPATFEAEKVVATFEHGILTLRVPKATIVQPQPISIQLKDPAAVKRAAVH
jgi:HSP20 family protein